MLLFGIAPFWLLGAQGAWLGGLLGDVDSGRLVGRAMALLVLTVAAVTYQRYERRERGRGRQDLADPRVQELHVRDPRVVEIALVSDDEPILCFAIGDGWLLYLQGQWLRDAETYGADWPEGDPCQDTLNGLTGAAAFPSTRFTVSRLPYSGRVLAIRCAGEYLPPEEIVDVLEPEYALGDSLLLEGELDDLAGVLQRAHLERETG